MPTFELEHNGKTYEVEAPDQNAALSAFGQMTGPAPRAGDQSAAVGRGLINGIPVAGPYLLGGLNRVAAGVRSLQNDTKFSDELRNVEGFSDATAEANPGSTLAGEVAGGVIGTAPIVAAAPAAFGAGAAALPMRMGAAALTGAGLGGADAAARSGGDPASTLQGAELGLGLGAAGPLVASGVGKVVGTLAGRLRPGVEPPTVADIRGAANQAYQAADDAGVRIAPESFSDAVKRVAASMQEKGLDKTITPKSMAAIGRLEEAVGTAPTLRDVDTLRQVASGAAGALEKSDARIGSKIVTALDDYVGGLKPSDVLAGDPEAGARALTDARSLWTQASKAERVADAIRTAQRRAETSGSGGNVDNAIRQNFRKLIEQPKLSRGFSEAEKEAMDAVISDSGGQKVLRALGKVAPGGNGIATMANMGAIAANPLMVIPSVGAMGAKALSDGATLQKAKLVELMIRNGGEVPISPAIGPASDAARQVTRVLMNQVPLFANRQQSVR